MTKVVKFNVGGTRYEVARSLLESYPETMLARMASEDWHDDSKGDEIFIERDGERFKYCLDFLRDGKVLLPITTRKEALLEDLQYYNIEHQYNNVIEYGAQEKVGVCTEVMFKAYKDLREELDSVLGDIAQLEHKRDWINLAMEVHAFLTRITLYSGMRREYYYTSSENTLSGHEIRLNLSSLLHSISRGDDEIDDLKRILNACEEQKDKTFGEQCFQRLGLNLIEFLRDSLKLEFFHK